MTHKTSWGTGVLRAFGLVFGDIGTSPIYTLTVVVALTIPTETHILGVLSLIFWTLILLVTVEYAWLAMSLGTRGEGGTRRLVVLFERLSVAGRHGRTGQAQVARQLVRPEKLAVAAVFAGAKRCRQVLGAPHHPAQPRAAVAIVAEPEQRRRGLGRDRQDACLADRQAVRSLEGIEVHRQALHVVAR